MKLKPLILVVVVVLVGVGLWQWNENRKEQEYLHRPIESKFTLTEAQKVDMPAADPNGVLVVRYKDSTGMWQVSLRHAPEGAKDVMPMGVLHSEAEGKTINVPVYLCSYPTGFPNPTSSLDFAENCSGGKNLLKQAAGYLSKDIREGYFLIFRCRTKKSGIYLTLNSRCESQDDMVQESLGAIRAVAN